MTRKFLALSISEKQPESERFNVIAMETSEYQMYPIRLEKNDIIDRDGIIIWDLGRITSAESVVRYNEPGQDPRNTEFLATNCCLTDEKVFLKRMLEENLTDITEFYNSPGMRFAIVKARGVLDIQLQKTGSNARPICRMQVSCGESSYPLLNKDYRWVNYWLWKYAQESEEQLEDDRNRYLQLLNRRDKSLYLILYRHFYAERSEVWIAGMHWL